MKKQATFTLYMAIFAITLMLSLHVQLSKAAETTTFSVTVSVENVVNLYGFDIKLCYDTSTLDLVEAVLTSPWAFSHVIKNEIDDFNGVYWLAMATVAPQEPFSGSTPLVTLTFSRIESGEDHICLTETQLTDCNGNPIPHIIDGLVIRGFPVHDVAVKKIVGYPKGVYQGDPIYFFVTVENQGDFVETFAVTVYADQDKTIIGDEIIVGTKTVYNMPAKSSEILEFIWDTTNAPCGHYFISAEAAIIEGEIDIADNFLKMGEYIGGIHPRPHIVLMANTLAQTISIGISILLTSLFIRYLKNMWFP